MKALKVSDLKPGMKNVAIRVKVLEVGRPRTVMTRRGQRTLTEVLVGDETGAVYLTVWGKVPRALAPGNVVLIRGAWTTTYKGALRLNVGRSSSVVAVGSAREELGSTS